MSLQRLTITAASALLMMASGASAQPASPPSKNQCFFMRDFDSWRAPDAKTIYIRVNMNRYYRLDLANQCSSLKWPAAHLITKTRGPDTVCSAIDWDIAVSQGEHSIPEHCIVKKMTRLTPDEVSAIPKKDKP